ncbi:MAG: BatD family protein [Saprospiraceae bacterium]
MRTFFILLMFCLTPFTGVFAQEGSDQNAAAFNVEASTAEILLGNPVEVQFILKNAFNVNFKAPDWDALNCDVLVGPNTSNSISILNGVRRSETTYQYYIVPREEGVFTIPSMSLESDSGTLVSEPIEIKVLPNPDGVQTGPQFDQRRTPSPAKKKRATVRI